MSCEQQREAWKAADDALVAAVANREIKAAEAAAAHAAHEESVTATQTAAADAATKYQDLITCLLG